MEFESMNLFLNGHSLLKNLNYIDPGTASSFMAAIIAAIAGLGLTLKLYWFKIKTKFSKN